MTAKIHQSVSVFVDTSIFVDDAAYGRVSGRVGLPTFPQVGDFVSLPSTDVVQDETTNPMKHYVLKVLSRTFCLDGEVNEVILELSEIETSSLEIAIQISRRLESDLKLMIEIY